MTNKEKLVETLSEILNTNNLASLKSRILSLKELLANSVNAQEEGDFSEDLLPMRIDTLISELDQIMESHTLERAKYYLKRLKTSLLYTKTNKINDINLSRWKEYTNIITDSLWILPRRDASGAHLGWYWGNFIPQIPHQIILRYTKKEDWVLDTFAGSGTTLIECRRLGRNGIGIELNSEVANRAIKLIQKEQNAYNVFSDIVIGDSRKINLKELLEKYQISQVQLIIMHPPYHDIICFSKDEADLSNAKNIKEFLKMFGEVLDNVTNYLANERYLVLVIGDKYAKGEWIPLGFYCMQEVLRRNYLLKSIVVKNFDETKGKRSQKELWRYRALVGNYYIFKHEYIMIFKKSDSL